MALLEVSLDNGESYTTSGKQYSFYEEPRITALLPPCRLTTGMSILAIKGEGMEAAGMWLYEGSVKALLRLY